MSKSSHSTPLRTLQQFRRQHNEEESPLSYDEKGLLTVNSSQSSHDILRQLQVQYHRDAQLKGDLQHALFVGSVIYLHLAAKGVPAHIDVESMGVLREKKEMEHHELVSAHDLFSSAE